MTQQDINNLYQNFQTAYQQATGEINIQTIFTDQNGIDLRANLLSRDDLQQIVDKYNSGGGTGTSTATVTGTNTWGHGFTTFDEIHGGNVHVVNNWSNYYRDLHNTKWKPFAEQNKHITDFEQYKQAWEEYSGVILDSYINKSHKHNDDGTETNSITYINNPWSNSHEWFAFYEIHGGYAHVIGNIQTTADRNRIRYYNDLYKNKWKPFFKENKNIEDFGQFKKAWKEHSGVDLDSYEDKSHRHDDEGFVVDWKSRSAFDKFHGGSDHVEEKWENYYQNLWEKWQPFATQNRYETDWAQYKKHWKKTSGVDLDMYDTRKYHHTHNGNESINTKLYEYQTQFSSHLEFYKYWNSEDTREKIIHNFKVKYEVGDNFQGFKDLDQVTYDRYLEDKDLGNTDRKLSSWESVSQDDFQSSYATGYDMQSDSFQRTENIKDLMEWFQLANVKFVKFIDGYDSALQEKLGTTAKNMQEYYEETNGHKYSGNNNPIEIDYEYFDGLLEIPYDANPINLANIPLQYVKIIDSVAITVDNRDWGELAKFFKSNDGLPNAERISLKNATDNIFFNNWDQKYFNDFFNKIHEVKEWYVELSKDVPASLEHRYKALFDSPLEFYQYWNSDKTRQAIIDNFKQKYNIKGDFQGFKDIDQEIYEQYLEDINFGEGAHENDWQPEDIFDLSQHRLNLEKVMEWFQLANIKFAEFDQEYTDRIMEAIDSGKIGRYFTSTKPQVLFYNEKYNTNYQNPDPMWKSYNKNGVSFKYASNPKSHEIDYELFKDNLEVPVLKNSPYFHDIPLNILKGYDGSTMIIQDSLGESNFAGLAGVGDKGMPLGEGFNCSEATGGDFLTHHGHGLRVMIHEWAHNIDYKLDDMKHINADYINDRKVENDVWYMNYFQFKDDYQKLFKDYFTVPYVDKEGTKRLASHYPEHYGYVGKWGEDMKPPYSRASVHEDWAETISHYAHEDPDRNNFLKQAEKELDQGYDLLMKKYKFAEKFCNTDPGVIRILDDPDAFAAKMSELNITIN